MPFSNAAKNLMLDHLCAATAGAGQITHVSLHDGDPGDTGANEISGGSYARKAIAHGTGASGGSISHDGTDPVIDVPAAKTILYVGFWSAITTGTFYGYAPINGGAVDGVGQGLNTGDIIEAPAHGLSDDDRVYFQAPVGGTLPTGIAAGTLYHVISGTTDTFQVSATQGGGAVVITVDGQVYFQKVIPEVFAGAGTYTLDQSTLKLEE
jgi:hypothetical protein